MIRAHRAAAIAVTLLSPSLLAGDTERTDDANGDPLRLRTPLRLVLARPADR